jgi:hypothetical protein
MFWRTPSAATWPGNADWLRGRSTTTRTTQPCSWRGCPDREGRQLTVTDPDVLFQLATDLPAAVLANMLGIHISVAVQWQRASAGDWTAYAADVSRRTGALPPAE